MSRDTFQEWLPFIIITGILLVSFAVTLLVHLD